MSSVNSVNSAELNAKSTFQRDYEQSSAFYKHEQPPQTRFNSLLKHPSQQAHSIKVRAQHSIYSTVLQITRAEFAKVTRMLLWKLRRNETVVVRLSVHFCTQKKPSTECKLQTWRTLVRLMTHETLLRDFRCATEVASVSYLVAESCNKVRNRNLNLFYFSATCFGNAER